MHGGFFIASAVNEIFEDRKHRLCTYCLVDCSLGARFISFSTMTILFSSFVMALKAALAIALRLLCLKLSEAISIKIFNLLTKKN